MTVLERIRAAEARTCPVLLREDPAYGWLPGGGVGVLFTFECQRILVKVLIVVYPGSFRFLRVYGRRIWSM